MTLHILALELFVLLAVWLALGAWQWDGALPARRAFIPLALAVACWCAGELFALRGLLNPLACQRIAYLGALALPPLWLGVASHAAGTELARRAPWFPALLLAPQAAIYTLFHAGRWSHLFLAPPNELGVAIRGPLWWVNEAYSAALIAIAAGVLVTSAWRKRAYLAWHLRLLAGVATLMALSGLAATGLGASVWRPDPTPLLFGAALLALRTAVFSGGIMQALPISQHDLIRQLPIGLILTDRRGVVVDVNLAAENQLGMPAHNALGRTIDAVLEQAGDHLLIEVSPVRSGSRESGQVVLIDPSQRKGISVRGGAG